MPLINSILTNTAALTIRNNLNVSNRKISCALERMSSGLKINRAKDNAANYVISSKLQNKLSGLDVAMNNLSHGQNLLNIADSSLENMIEQTTRIRDLCLQAKNGSLGKDELNAIQEEIWQLTSELERQRSTTKYNGTKIFETKEIKEVEVQKPYAKRLAYLESTGVQYIDTGYIPNENTEIIANAAFLENDYNLQQYGCIINKNGKYSRWHFGVYQNKLCTFKTSAGSTGDVSKAYDDEFHEYYLSDSTAGLDDQFITPSDTQEIDVSFTLFARNGYVNNGGSANVGYYTKSRIKDLKIYENSQLIHSYIPVVDNNGKAALYDEITGTMLYNRGSGEFIKGEEVEEPIEKVEVLVDKEPTKLQIGYEAGDEHTLDVSLGFDFGELDFNVLYADKISFAIKKADKLIDALCSKRAEIGAVQNRMDSISELQEINKVNLSAFKSNISDADIAKESADLIGNQILQQVSTALFGQANSINGNLAKRLLNLN